ncbi:hypothetical protein H0H87_006762 [Tephrocybe sp. NHM501043]|nr:hypothetical protein H0H87_006762 [Tephrocybe sp. NHM501043]
MLSTMSWLVLLALAWRGMAQAPKAYFAARQNPPLLLFIGLSDAQLTSCTSTTFSWVYTGPDEPLSIFISNSDVQQDAGSTALPTFTKRSTDDARLHARANIEVTIASSISPNDGSFNVTSVAVPPGRYKLSAIVATSPPYLTNSSTFTVQAGSDTSCLTPSSSTSASSSSSTLPSSTSSSDTATITSNDSSPSGSASSTTVPIGAVTSSPVNKGAIAGGVAAGAIILIGAVAFYLLFIARNRRNQGHARAPAAAHVHASKGAPGDDIGGRWGGLGSVDSHVPLSDPKTQKPHVNTRHRTNGGASQDDNNSYLSRSGSIAHGGYAGSPSEEKFAGSPSEELVLSTLAYHSPSSNGHGSPNNGRSYSTSSTTPSEHPRRGSQSQARRPSLDFSASHAQSPFATPPMTSPIGLVRSSSTSGQNPPRKPARKPVPSYTDSPTSPATSPMSAMPTFPPSPPTPFADPPPAISPSGHYSTRTERESLKSVASKKSRSSKSKLRDKDKDTDRSNGSSANASTEEVARQELAHKNSFGPGGVEGKQLHYLIPDMPVRH